MGVVGKLIRKAAVRISISKKALKIAPSNIKAAFNFKSGKTVKNLMPLLNDTDSLAYYTASKANKRGIKQYGNVKALAGKSAKSLVVTSVVASGAMSANNFRKLTPKEKKQTVDYTKNKLADGYKYVYGKIRRVKGA